LRFVFGAQELRELYEHEKGAHRHAAGVVDAFFEVMEQIASATDVRDLYALRGLRLEKLKGDRGGQHSMRLNRQWRLIVEFCSDQAGTLVKVLEIADYH